MDRCGSWPGRLADSPSNLSAALRAVMPSPPTAGRSTPSRSKPPTADRGPRPARALVVRAGRPRAQVNAIKRDARYGCDTEGVGPHVDHGLDCTRRVQGE